MAESRGKTIPWLDLLRAKYEWNGSLDAIKDAAKARAADGGIRDATGGARLVGAGHDVESLKRACRNLRGKVNEQLGLEALTTAPGLMLSSPDADRTA